jgi:hypothetical protein
LAEDEAEVACDVAPVNSTFSDGGAWNVQQGEDTFVTTRTLDLELQEVEPTADLICEHTRRRVPFA